MLETAVIALVAAVEAQNKRLDDHMQFIKRLARATDTSLAPSFQESLAAGDAELIAAHFAAMDPATMPVQ